MVFSGSCPLIPAPDHRRPIEGVVAALSFVTNRFHPSSFELMPDLRSGRRPKNFHWHDLRHTFASRLAMAGVPIRTIADLMGHSEVQTTARYAHLAPGYLAEAVERLAVPIAVPDGGQSDTAIDTKDSEVCVSVG